MNRGELTRAVSELTGEPVVTVEEVLTGITTVIAMSINADDHVAIRGFGRFVPRIKSAGIKVDPISGLRRRIPARKTVVFYPSDSLKDRLNGARKRAKRK